MSTISLSLDSEELALLYERASANQQVLIGKSLIASLAPAPGQHILDVGSGTGLLAEHVADLVGLEGRVTGVDPLRLRIEIANRNARPNLSFAVANAYDLTAYAPASFDIVYLNAVFHWFDEKTGPLRQFHRLLKTGGRLGLTTSHKDSPNILQAAKDRVLSRDPYRAHSAVPNADGSRRVTPEELRALLEQTGYKIEILEIRSIGNVVRATADELIQFSDASAFGNFLGHLPVELRAAAHREIVAELEPHRTAGGFVQEARRLYAVATKA